MASDGGDSLDRALAALDGTVDESDFGAVLTKLVEDLVPTCGVTGAGLMFSDDSGNLVYVVATDEAGRALEVAEARAGGGPCVTAFVDNDLVTTDDVGTDDRWPELAGAVAGVDIAAVAGVPLRLSGVPVGTLDVYVAEPHAWTDRQLDLLRSQATIIDALLVASVQERAQHDLSRQLQAALDSRVLIERAVGMLMERHGVTSVAAFDLLRRRARNERRRVHDVADEVLRGAAPGR